MIAGIIGFFIGGIFGVLIMALAISARRADDDMEKFREGVILEKASTNILTYSENMDSEKYKKGGE